MSFSHTWCIYGTWLNSLRFLNVNISSGKKLLPKTSPKESYWVRSLLWCGSLLPGVSVWMAAIIINSMEFLNFPLIPETENTSGSLGEECSCSLRVKHFSSGSRHGVHWLASGSWSISQSLCYYSTHQQRKEIHWMKDLVRITCLLPFGNFAFNQVSGTNLLICSSKC